MRKILNVFTVFLAALVLFANVEIGECAKADNLKDKQKVDLKVGKLNYVVVKPKPLDINTIRLSSKGFKTCAYVRIFEDYLSVTTTAPVTQNPKAKNSLVFKLDDTVFNLKEIGTRKVSHDYLITDLVTEKIFYAMPAGFMDKLAKADSVGFRLQQCEVKKTEVLTDKAVTELRAAINDNKKLEVLLAKAKHRAITFKDRVLLIQKKIKPEDCKYDEEKAKMFFEDMRKKENI